MTDEPLNARELGMRSRAAVHDRDRDGWLALFAADALVQDPIGPSPFDPEGKGHRGIDAIAAFYDTVIAPSEAVDFEITQSYLAGAPCGRGRRSRRPRPATRGTCPMASASSSCPRACASSPV